MSLILALRTGSHPSISQQAVKSKPAAFAENSLGWGNLFLKSNFGGLIHHSSTLIFLGTTCQQNVSSLGIQVNPWERGCCTSRISTLGFFIQRRDCWRQEDVAEGLLEVLLLAMASPVSFWGLSSTTNRCPPPAEDNRPVKIPLLGCKTSRET